jgi:hypothetical protein
MRREASPAAIMPPSPGSLLWDLPAYPESYAARLVTIAALAGHLSAKLGRAPTDQEVARVLAMSVAKLRRLRG